MKKIILGIQVSALILMIFAGALMLFTRSGSAEGSPSAVLSEFSIDEEWVEMMNFTSEPIDLTGWTIVYTEMGPNGSTTTLDGILPAYGLRTFIIENVSSTGGMFTIYNDSEEIVGGQVGYGDWVAPNQVSTPEAGESAVLDYGVWSITTSPSRGWFNNAVDYDCPLTASLEPPTLSSIATCLLLDGIETNLDTVLDPSEMSGDSGLYFEKEGLGKVKFDGLLNFTDYAVVSAIQSLGEKLMIDAGNLRFPSDMGSAMDVPGGANIIFYDIGSLGFSTGTRPEGVGLNIVVKNDDGDIIPAGAGPEFYPTIDGFYLDSVSGNLSFNVSHFTEFELNPTVIEITPVDSPTTNANLEYVFYTDVVGSVSYEGSCSGNATTSVIGNNSIVFDTLEAGTYTNCVVVVTDSASRSTSLLVTPFTVVVPEEVYVFEAEFEGGLQWGVNGFTDIQSAIDAVAEGGTVNVASGTYEENVTINKQLSLIGDVGDGSVGVGENAPTVIGLVDGDKSTITINASGVTVKGFIIQNDTSGFPGVVVSSAISDSIIRNNEITNVNAPGIILGATSYENLITKNKVYGNSEGINIWGSNNNVISYNDIYGSTNEGIGLYFNTELLFNPACFPFDCIASGEVGANNILNNHIYSNGSYGIYIDDEVETAEGLVNINSNIIEENDNFGISIGSLVTNISIQNNTIINNGSSINGIYVVSALNNHAYNNIIYSDIEGKGTVAIYNYDVVNDFDAVQNYWGSEFGPYEVENTDGNPSSEVDGRVVEMVKAIVNYKPYYTDEAMTSLKGIEVVFGVDQEYFKTVYEVSTETFGLTIPAGTTVSGYAGWDGTINAPTTTVIGVAEQPAGTGVETQITMAFEVGSGGGKLLLGKAAKLVFTGQAGKKVGYIRAGAEFTEITALCGENSQVWADANLGAEGDCKIDDGADLVVWTKHFTKFVAYTQTPITSSGGGGGGVLAVSSPCVSVTYDEWGSCVNGKQYRNLLTQVPGGCALTNEQQSARSRTCGLETAVEAIVAKVSKVSDINVKGVMDQERALVTRINTALTNRLSGRILLQVEQQGQAWYLEPVSKTKHFMGRPLDAFNLMRKFGLGISNANLKRFQDSGVPRTFAGRIFLQVESVGEAYYVNPIDLKMHYLGRPADAFRIMRELALGITNSDIRQITVGE
jgi:parallel beta-helix repeat protein